MKDILDIKSMLVERVQAVCEHLLPGGIKSGSEFKAGSVSGEKGESLCVRINGAKAGIWSDFATGETGDLIDLWCASKAMNFKDAIDEIRGYLGVVAPSFQGTSKTYNRPQKPKCKAPSGLVKGYLTGARKITEEVIQKYKIAESGNKIIFPFMRDGELIMCKSREAIDGGKPKPTEGGCEKILFGWQAIDPNSRFVVICEGEIDALSGGVYGLPALSVPFGGGGGNKQDWIESEYDNLSRFEDIYLALDADGPGQEATAEIIKRLGNSRCHIVSLPRKDLNQCLIDGISKEEIGECIKSADSLMPDGLKHSDHFLSQVIELMHPVGGIMPGYGLPFFGFDKKIRFRPGEISIWTGKTSAGKSQILSHVTVDLVKQGAKTCIASLEMSGAQNLKRMTNSAVNRRWDEEDPLSTAPTVPLIEAAFDWWSGSIYIFDKIGKAGVEPILDIFDYALKRFGCDVFIVDSLMRLGVGSEDYEGQERAVYSLVNWAVQNNVHLHLVAHSRKGNKEKGQATVPELDDIKGAQEIAANAFNVFAVWRNKKHEDELQAAKSKDAAILEELQNKPGVILNVAKQRNGDWEGKIKLWYDKGSQQYRSKYDSPDGYQYVRLSARKQ